MEYSEKVYSEAKMVAFLAHKGHTYDIFPYEKHLEDVVDIVKKFGYSGKYIVGAYLHDTIEDANLSYNKIKKAFGLDVAEIVFAVTDELGRNRKEKKEKTYPKIKSNPDALVVKLADRIANVEHGIRKTKMYKEEFAEFRNELFVEGQCVKMWDYLEKLLG
jgi:(p)ppGpp synthase/HD superfamily hydrolase